ncbi:MAG TPA: NUDIX hydrolase [Pseudolabrys sp.]|nr:NUDIX hydrolase [Pseudolabrys sp.]
MNEATKVVHTERLELGLARERWPFADENAPIIDAYFAALRRATPELWNGRVLVLLRYALEGNVFRGRYIETDYANLTAYRHWGHAGSARDSFGAAAVISSDGAILLGRMSDRTVNAGQLYFFCGTPDLSDVVDGRVDLDFSVKRELKEESGLDIGELSAEPGWTTVMEPGRIAHIKLLRSRDDAKSLQRRMLAHLASEAEPELCDIVVVRGAGDFDRTMPSYVTAFLRHYFAGG